MQYVNLNGQKENQSKVKNMNNHEEDLFIAT